MKVVPALLALVLIPAAAQADDRETFASFGGGMSAIGPWDGGEGGPEDVGLQLRGTISFEEPPLPFAEPRGYAARATLVPELFGGLLTAGDDRSALFGGGLRVELQFSQRRMGLLEVSLRGGIYMAARAGLFTDPERTPFGEGAVGEYVQLSSTVRLGVELGIMTIRTSTYEVLPVAGAISGPPFEQGSGSYLSVNAAALLGVAL